MKNYTKPTLEIAKITTNEAIAAGSPTMVGVDNSGDVPVTIYQIDSFTDGSAAQSEVTGA